MAMQPDLQSDVNLVQLATIAALNPVVIGVAFALGRRCDQVGKLLIAGFAGGLAGIVPIWLAAELRMPFIAEPARAAAGLFVLQGLFGILWASAGYVLIRRTAR